MTETCVPQLRGSAALHSSHCTASWVLVTGASRGVGAAIAEALAASHFNLVLWARSAPDLARVAEKARAHGVSVRTANVDVSDPVAVAAAARESLSDIAGLSGLVLNAGLGRWAPMSDLDVEDWQQTLQTNLSGGFFVLKHTLDLLIKGPNAIVVGMLSDAAIHAFGERAAYAASKAGMYSLLETARRELRPHGVRVSLVVPSRIDTYFAGSYESAEPGTRQGALSAADVAGVVTYLFGLPSHIELREAHVCATTATFGPYPERLGYDNQ